MSFLFSVIQLISVSTLPATLFHYTARCLSVTMVWLVSDLSIFRSFGFFAIRSAAVQYSGARAIACMSVAMMHAIRPRWPEHGLGGLDKMYRLHKWLDRKSTRLNSSH